MIKNSKKRKERKKRLTVKNGKGDRNRTADNDEFRENYDKINWSKSK